MNQVANKEKPRIKVKNEKEVIPELMDKFNYKNKYEVPKLEKIIINIGIGEGAQDVKIVDGAVQDLSVITGQKPVVTRAKKSIAGFKIRAGMPVGVKVTLRRDRMYEFFDRLVSIALPRIRDFRGLSYKSFDGNGNFTIGVDEQLIFPEIDYDKIYKVIGMDITIVTTAKNDDEGYALLSSLGMPFRAR